MSELYQDKKILKDRLREFYRISVVHEESLSERKSYRVRLGQFYLLLTLMVLSIIAFVSFLFMATPLKKMVPGYADVENNAVFVELNGRINELEEEMDQQTLYIEGLLRRMASPVSELQLEKKNGNHAAIDFLDQLHFVSPVKGSIEHGFSVEDGHLGTDIIAPKNTPIKAVLDGVVISSDWTLENGNTISIQHKQNLLSVYKHNSVLLKEQGSVVKAGEAVAIIGNTGENSSGPHLHIELWFEGKAIDPEEYINF